MCSKKFMFAASLFALAFGVNGEIINVEVKAEVSSLNDSNNFFDAIQINDQLVLSYTFDCDSQDIDTNSNRGTYVIDNADMSVSLGGYSFSDELLYTIVVEDDVFDSYSAVGYSSIAHNTVGKLDFGMEFYLLDETGNAFDNTNLPQTFNPVGYWTDAVIKIEGTPRGEFEIVAQVSNIQSVPEPCTIVVLGLGAIGMLRKKSNQL
ncbi:PEP-CTERM sorting domain-containing protein [Sedimentisphaera salicampi]|uniref:PEP-CTERM sorting domain-containing protein n=1 Tax=Sedimentisphaera salicampi TaxID=1941349 RepID=UPI000B9A3369|nr:PEP-CTERM sorting domain-containing protein [Sedimentisphaera salicampi]OXU14511.1 hypothetical protein SMSP1_01822 [Sedimentisphaera salicampi]